VTRETLKIKHFEDLKVWQLTHKLSLETAELVKSFPRSLGKWLFGGGGL
jgi:hypothetical protein